MRRGCKADRSISFENILVGRCGRNDDDAGDAFRKENLEFGVLCTPEAQDLSTEVCLFHEFSLLVERDTVAALGIYLTVSADELSRLSIAAALSFTLGDVLSDMLNYCAIYIRWTVATDRPHGNKKIKRAFYRELKGNSIFAFNATST